MGKDVCQAAEMILVSVVAFRPLAEMMMISMTTIPSMTMRKRRRRPAAAHPQDGVPRRLPDAVREDALMMIWTTKATTGKTPRRAAASLEG